MGESRKSAIRLPTISMQRLSRSSAHLAAEFLVRLRLKVRFSHSCGNRRTVTDIRQYRSGPRQSCKTAEIFPMMALITSEEASEISVIISPSVNDFSYHPSTSVSRMHADREGITPEEAWFGVSSSRPSPLIRISRKE